MFSFAQIACSPYGQFTARAGNAGVLWQASPGHRALRPRVCFAGLLLFGGLAMDWRIKRAIEWIDQHSEQDLSLQFLAAHCQMSSRHLGRLFRKNAGAGFNVYLRSVRMKRAANLLLSTSHSVKEIAGWVGYSRASNFDRDFRATYNTRPRDYRVMQSPLFQEEATLTACNSRSAKAGD